MNLVYRYKTIIFNTKVCTYVNILLRFNIPNICLIVNYLIDINGELCIQALNHQFINYIFMRLNITETNELIFQILC